MYSIRLELTRDSANDVYTVTSPDVPGLVTEGRTPEEIQRNVQDALAGLLEVWQDLGMDVPAALQDARARPPQKTEILVAA